MCPITQPMAPLGCVTTRILTNAKKSFNDADELDGFEDLDDEDQ